mmetsp:Transcript_16323/g.24703  ORF Transcript_16323/g.24703 Transcript_16323/m.24703 type:complete len:202 (+) Transcript_16323:153-758(+)|eukprot:CAMPEP_0178925628 /NCGR_PEP_ID=MMETSP0786-20121207/18030_1 /TAXON_ID=186022 /ORGANISM="Thalassionema frauenfeldii, Strain CCMP 1798" /LENGTH=201 /DNA_ID=CAMNT_0020600555 /DNA_START=83 /DNA_END=688 /DNA_ORIENTATION=+
MKKSTRTFLEVTVGTTHNLEVILHVRQSDSEWYFSRHDEIIGLLSSRVIPREFETEITDYHKKANGSLQIQVGEKNKSATTNTGRDGKRKRKRGNSKTITQQVSEKSHRETRHVFGENIQLSYRLQDITSDVNHSVTISVGWENEKLAFEHLPKLSKRLVVWCFPFVGHPSDEDVDILDGGFPRPDLIPMSHLFREPPESA